jgi:hypothetical protein
MRRWRSDWGLRRPSGIEEERQIPRLVASSLDQILALGRLADFPGSKSARPGAPATRTRFSSGRPRLHSYYFGFRRWGTFRPLVGCAGRSTILSIDDA